MDQGFFVASDTGRPATDYADTDGNWDGVDLPEPTADVNQLRADMADWGYCLVKEAVSPEQLEALRERFDAQIAGEQAAGLSTARFPQQTGFSCAVNKGEVFRGCVTLDERTVQKGGMIEQLLTEILGDGWIMNNLVPSPGN